MHFLQGFWVVSVQGLSRAVVVLGGGTATLARILQFRYGTPLSSAYLYTDSIVIFLAGITFGWEPALLALVTLFLNGIASDYFLEGPSLIRTVTIITEHPGVLSERIMELTKRGVTAWEGMGMYMQEKRTILYVTIPRAQVYILQEVVRELDPNAFMVIEQGHVAYGEGFKPIKHSMRKRQQTMPSITEIEAV